MLSSFLKISNTAEGLTASPKISHDLPATLGVKPSSLNFQQLMNSRLGALNSHKNGAASLSFLNSMTKQFADFSPRGLGHSELLSIKQIVQSFKTQAGKSQKPLVFQFNSKSLGKISFEIEPAKNQLKVGLNEEHLDVSELFIAELAPLFDQIEFGPVFSFQKSVFSNQLSTHSFQSSALGSQLSATQVFGVIKELIEGSGKLPVKANNLGQKIELNVESIGKVAVDLKSVNGKLLVQIGLPSKQTLENFKTGLLKSTGFSEGKVKFFIAKPGQNTQLTQMPVKLEIKNGLMRDRQTPKVSMRQAIETIQKKVVEVRYSHSTVLNFKQPLNLDIKSLGKVSVKIESGKDKIGLNVGVDSQAAGNVLKKQLTPLIVKSSDLKIFVRSAGKNAGKKVSSVALLAKVGTKITPSQAVATVEKVVEAVTQASAKVSSKLQFGLQTDSLGDIETEVEISRGKPNLKLTVDSNSAKNLLSERLGPGIQNLDIRVKEVGTSKRGKGFDGQFKLNSKLTTSQTIQSIREVVESLLQAPSKSGQNQIQVQMEVENHGKIFLGSIITDDFLDFKQNLPNFLIAFFCNIRLSLTIKIKQFLFHLFNFFLKLYFLLIL